MKQKKSLIDQHKYFAFISYSRRDVKHAKWLQKKIESYKLPSILHTEQEEDLPSKLQPVFRDETDLTAGGYLSDKLYAKLKESKYLVVICSPNAVASKYVDEEIKNFIAINGDASRIIPFIVDGEVDTDVVIKRCYPPSLEQSVLGIDIRKTKREVAYLHVVAQLLELDFDYFFQRHKKEQIKKWKKRAAISLAVLFPILLFIVFAAYVIGIQELIETGNKQMTEGNAVGAALLYRDAKLKNKEDYVDLEIQQRLRQAYYRNPDKSFVKFCQNSKLNSLSIGKNESLVAIGTVDGTVSIRSLVSGDVIYQNKFDEGLKYSSIANNLDELYVLKKDNVLQKINYRDSTIISTIDLYDVISNNKLIGLRADSLGRFVAITLAFQVESDIDETVFESTRICVCDTKKGKVLFNPHNAITSNICDAKNVVQYTTKNEVVFSVLGTEESYKMPLSLSNFEGGPKYIYAIDNQHVWLTDLYRHVVVNVKTGQVKKRYSTPFMQRIVGRQQFLAGEVGQNNLGCYDILSGRLEKRLSFDAIPEAVDSNGDTLVYMRSGVKQTCMFYDAVENKDLYLITPKHEKELAECLLSDSYFVYGTQDGEVSVYPRYDNTLARQYHWDKRYWKNSLLDANLNHGLVYDYNQKCMVLCDIKTGRPIINYTSFNKRVFAAKMTTENIAYFIEKSFSTIILYEVSLENNRILRRCEFKGFLESTAFSPSSKLLLLHYNYKKSVEDDYNGRLKLIDLASFEELKTYPAIDDFKAVAVDDSAKELCAFTSNDCVHTMNLQTMDTINLGMTFHAQGRFVKDFEVSSDKNYILTTLTNDEFSSKFFLLDGFQNSTVNVFYSWPHQYLFSTLVDDGKYVMGQQDDGQISIWKNVDSEYAMQEVLSSIGNRAITDEEMTCWE